MRCVLKAENTALLVRISSRNSSVMTAGSTLSASPWAVASLNRRRVS
jgi:hypothetical protein